MFMAVPKADVYRWIGRRSDADGDILSKVRTDPVAATWHPLNVAWLPETAERPTCDFPIFHPIVRCISQRAADVLAPFTEGSVELLAIQGLQESYVAAHCIQWVEALIPMPLEPNMSIHSTNYIPRLKRSAVEDLEIFGVFPIVAKLFVSSSVKSAVESAGLTGLEFYPVELA